VRRLAAALCSRGAPKAYTYPSMPIAPGTKLGQYEITARIGAGGMGEVFRARDTRFGRSVAIKVLPEEFAGDAARLKRFEQEARAAC
jgi:serine/threonine protein kinase